MSSLPQQKHDTGSSTCNGIAEAIFILADLQDEDAGPCPRPTITDSTKALKGNVPEDDETAVVGNRHRSSTGPRPTSGGASSRCDTIDTGDTVADISLTANRKTGHVLQGDIRELDAQIEEATRRLAELSNKRMTLQQELAEARRREEKGRVRVPSEVEVALGKVGRAAPPRRGRRTRAVGTTTGSSGSSRMIMEMKQAECERQQYADESNASLQTQRLLDAEASANS